MSNLDEVLDKYFHHNVLELDVHHGGHSFLLWPHQRRPKDDAQVGYRHQVELALCGNPAGREKWLLTELWRQFNQSQQFFLISSHALKAAV